MNIFLDRKSYVQISTKNTWAGLERKLKGLKNWIPFQRTEVQFPEPTLWLTLSVTPGAGD